MSAPGFWDKPEAAQEVGRKRARVEKRIQAGGSIESKAEELDVLLELQREGESVDGDIETGSLMAGQSVGMVTREQSTREIIAELVDQAVEALIAREQTTRRIPEAAS